TALMLAEVLNNVMQTQNTEALKFTVTASAMTCAKVAGNVTNGALDLSATGGTSSLQMESSTAPSSEAITQSNIFPGGITTTGNVTFVDAGTCP
ncbi:MAG TPA: hypothetical protein PLO43_05495, partial [Chlamydiales bacterium]|nr:hypothetical protein [Chlamydiales bacterium]